MFEQLIGFGSAALEVGSKAAPIFGVISGIAGWSSRNRIIEEMQKQRVALERIAEGVDLSRTYGNIVLPKPQEVDFRRVNHLLVPARKALKTDIIVSEFLRTPDAMRNQFQRNVWDCLVDIRPVTKTDFNKSPDWVPLMFEWENQIFVGWQKKGMLISSFELDFETSPETWAKQARKKESGRQPSGSGVGKALHEGPERSSAQVGAGPTARAEIGRLPVEGRAGPARATDDVRPAPTVAKGAANKDNASPRRTGSVKWFSPSRGFGFIVPDGGGPDVFVHKSAVVEAMLKVLEEGDRVSFEVSPDRQNQIKATNIQMLKKENAGKGGKQS